MERRQVKRLSGIMVLTFLCVTVSFIAMKRAMESPAPESWVFATHPPATQNHAFTLSVRSENLTASLLGALLSQGAGRLPSAAKKDQWAITIAGSLRLDIARHDDGSETWTAHFHNLEMNITQNGVALASEIQAASALFAQPITIQVNERGAFQGLTYQKTASLLANSMPRLLLGMWQIERPAPRAVTTSWQTDEQESFARVTARYTLAERSSLLLEFDKRILTVASGPDPVNPDAAAKVSVDGSTHLGLDRATGLVRTITSHRTIRSTIQDVPVSSSTITFDARFLDAKDRRVTHARKPSAPPTQEGFTQDTTGDQDEALARATLGATDPVELLTVLDDVGSLPFSTDGREGLSQIKLALKLEAALTLDPAFAARLAEDILERPGSDPAFVLVMSAFANVGNRACETALLKIAAVRGEDKDAQYLVLQAFGLLREATPESEAYLRTMARTSHDPIAQSTAALSLGSMAKSLRWNDPRRSDAIVAEAVRTATVEPAEGPRNLAIAVLGNAATPVAEETLLNLVRSPKPDVRREAAAALSVVTTPEATQALVEAGTRDTEHDVRQRALQALAGRRIEPAHLAAIAAAFQASSDSWEKRLLVSLGASIAPADASTLGFIERAMQDDDQTVRRHAEAVRLTLKPNRT